MDENRVLQIEIPAESAPSGPPSGESGITAPMGRPMPALVIRAPNPEKLLRMLTVRNLALLKIIRSKSPHSLTELARLSGRPKASLTRTLKRFVAFGIVNFRKTGGRGKAPAVTCDCVRLEVGFGTEK